MSASLFLALEQPVSGFDVTHMDGVALFKALPHENQENALTPLARFFSIGAEDWENLLEGTPEFADLPVPTTWFSPDDGLAVVRSILETLRDQPPALNVSPNALQAIRMDLQALEAGLVLAQNADTRFHLACDF